MIYIAHIKRSKADIKSCLTHTCIYNYITQFTIKIMRRKKHKSCSHNCCYSSYIHQRSRRCMVLQAGSLRIDLTGCKYFCVFLFVLTGLMILIRLDCSLLSPPPAGAWCRPAQFISNETGFHCRSRMQPSQFIVYTMLHTDQLPPGLRWAGLIQFI